MEILISAISQNSYEISCDYDCNCDYHCSDNCKYEPSTSQCDCFNYEPNDDCRMGA